MSIVQEIVNLSPISIIELVELDCSIIKDINGVNGVVHYFHNGTNYVDDTIEWNGQEYLRYPVQMSGFEVTNKGEIPRPTVRVGNVGQGIGLISSLILDFKDLLGAKVTRIRTFAKYLDAVNYPGGVNDDADPTVEFSRQIFYVNRKISETAQFVEFELSSKWDLNKVMLPKRLVLQNTCMWLYTGTECGWTPTAGKYYDKFDQVLPDGSTNDACGKKMRSCILRHGETAVLPYGGFPGVGKIR